MDTKQWKRALATVAGLAVGALAGCTVLPETGDGWTAMPLLEDLSDLDRPAYHAGNSRVTGVRYASLDDGVVVVAGDNATFLEGGAVFGATATEVTELRHLGRSSSCTGKIDFHGLTPTPDGYVALTAACELVASHDGGKTFSSSLMGGGDGQGLEAALALRVTAAGSVLVRDTGVVSRATTAPGEGSTWQDVWAPTAIPPTPAEVPANQCQAGPVSQLAPVETQAAYIGPDGDFLAYVANPDSTPQICLSYDGGRSFFPSRLTVPSSLAPTGVLFLNDQVGLTWYAASFDPAATYIRRTTDGGATWAEVELPARLQGARLSLREAFFAPSGLVGWMVGFDHSAGGPLLLKTRDGGASFEALDSGLAELAPNAQLFTGFALDETHIWVGGEYGALLHSDTGGE